MAIVKKNEAMPKRPTVTVLYGQPGCGKTSLCNTAKNPLLIDCDRGADRAINRQDSLVCNSWTDIVKEKESFKDYDTIIIDTAKACLDDFLMTYVKEKDDTCKKNQLKAYGAIGQEFKEIVSYIRSLDKDVIIIAHAKEDKDGDVTKFAPDVTGGSKELILRIADQVGFVSVVNQKRTIRFEPDERIIGKNVAKLPMQVIPDESDPAFANAMERIIDAVKTAIQKRSNEQAEALELLKKVDDAIVAIQKTEDADKVLTLIKNLPKVHHKTSQAKLLDKCNEMGFKYDKGAKKFTLPDEEN